MFPTKEELHEWFYVGKDGGLFRKKAKGGKAEGSRFGAWSDPAKSRVGHFNGRMYSEYALTFIMGGGTILPRMTLMGDIANPTLENISQVPLSVHRHRKGSNRPGKLSKYRNVSYSKRSEKWFSYVSLNGKRYYLGFYHSEDEAANAYNQRAVELYGDNAVLNEINSTVNKDKV